jgi:hypothetical protein
MNTAIAASDRRAVAIVLLMSCLLDFCDAPRRAMQRVTAPKNISSGSPTSFGLRADRVNIFRPTRPSLS